MNRAERLRSYVEASMGVSATWDACSTWPAQWVSDELGCEFDWPAYGSQDEGMALVDRMGGLAEVWKGVARQAGLEPLVRPDDISLGDVGVIETHTRGQVGGIFADGGAFCWRSENGVRILPARSHIACKSEDGARFRPVIIKAWRI